MSTETATSPHRDLQAKLLPGPFVSSWVGRARPGDLHDGDPAARAAAWATWAMGAITEMTGLRDRSYVALTLDGKFYDPRGTGPTVRPHLEIPDRVLRSALPDFPDRLGEMGSGLSFGWWIFPEVVAARRALFNTPRGSLEVPLRVVRGNRAGLLQAVQSLMATAARQWSKIEGLLISDPEELAGVATGDFSTSEIAEFFPGAEELGLQVVFDSRLREAQGQWVSRRVGIWQITGSRVLAEGGPERFGWGVVTPRLTANSLFRDELFAPDRESASALLVRGLLLRRLIQGYLSGDDVQVSPQSAPEGPGPRLRAVPARVGQKLPEASVAAAVGFLQAYPDPEAAWRCLETWGAAGHMLTVTKDAFCISHANALRYLRRAEQPERDDINLVLPLAWDADGKVVRATFARAPGDGQQ